MTKEYLKQLIESGDRFAMYFYNPSCTFCKEVNKVLKNTLPSQNPDEPVAAVHKLKLDDYKELGYSLSIETVPTLIVVSRQEYVRYVGSNDIIDYLNSFNG